MATTRPTLGDEIASYHDRCEAALRPHGMSFRTFRIIKAVTQLVGMIAGIYAMPLGADPLAALTLMTLLYGGPEAVEHILDTGRVAPPPDEEDHGRDE